MTSAGGEGTPSRQDVGSWQRPGTLAGGHLDGYAFTGSQLAHRRDAGVEEQGGVVLGSAAHFVEGLLTIRSTPSSVASKLM